MRGEKGRRPGDQPQAKGNFLKQVVPQKPRMTALRGSQDEHRAATGEEAQGR